MIINNAPKNEAILSNVGEVGEFRIRNSAKAFGILSSGLYANKIRAIIRELSCNAVDSHIAAGRADSPFDVHLPNSLEPWFAIRDYGTGLNHEQVTNIYTTYFESTKTESNDFIGALGLGSKSPFSYTDNFSVIAIKDGHKGVYTAFINEAGVPSIALMTEEDTDEPSGVEIRFGVEDSYDFRKFAHEARFVYRHFKLRPVVTGFSEFEFEDIEFVDQDIIPGVHSIGSRGYGYSSVAIMGNIEYPIDIPNATQNLGDLVGLLKCGLVMEFDIGELDFQASREGLSYIPQTIASIKRKLEQVRDALVTRLAVDADAIENEWDRAVFLVAKANTNLWGAAVSKYIADTKFALVSDSGRYGRTHKFLFSEEELEKRYNIKLRGFTVSRGWNATTCSNERMDTEYDYATKKQLQRWGIWVADNIHFVINDTKVGAVERAKYHWRSNDTLGEPTVYVIEAADRNKEVNTKKFFAAIHNPPKDRIHNASDLDTKEKTASIGRNVSILKLEQRDHGWTQRSKDLVWRDAGKLSTFDSSTHYFLPLVGFKSQGKFSDMRYFAELLKTAGIYDGVIYGVRKADMENIEKLSNWVNIEDFVKQKLAATGQQDYLGVVKKSIDFDSFYAYNAHTKVDAASPYVVFYDTLKDITSVDGNGWRAMQTLSTNFDVSVGTVKIEDMIADYQAKINAVRERYPLLSELGRYCTNSDAVAEYINAIDNMKGI